MDNPATETLYKLTAGQHNTLHILLALSVALLAFPIILFAIRKIFKCGKDKGKKSGVSPWLAFSAFLIGSIWCIRYAVGYYAIIADLEDSSGLSRYEEFFNSIVHTLQTFSMDEDHAFYILNGRKMIASMFDNSAWLQDVYGAYASILNTVAPIAGGAIIFEILASVFPKIRLSFWLFAIWRDKYYFSELNEEALAILKALKDQKYPLFRKPIFIFTDAYMDDESEESSELMTSAKSMGAICVRDDITHVKKKARGKKHFFLVDPQDINNLKCLTSLTEDGNHKYLKGADITILLESDNYSHVEERVRDILKNTYSFTDDEMPTIKPAPRYRNMIFRLLMDVPLYEPLIGKAPDSDNKRELNVTILGTGVIGVEMFLSTYWFCQMLNCKTTVNVVSKESEEIFWSKIDSVNPEIRLTTEECNPILRYNKSGDCSEPYCKVNYTPCDIASSEYISLMNKSDDNAITKADYILVALGSDEANIAAANNLCKFIGHRHIKEKSENGNCCGKTVIAYVVYDSNLANTLNRKNHYCFTDGTADVYMKAIGDMDSLYSSNSLFMSDHMDTSANIHNRYVSLQEKTVIRYTSKVNNRKRAGSLDADYKYWANLARALHQKYKAFSAGFATLSIFEAVDEERRRAYEEAQDKMLQDYKDFATGGIDELSPEDAARNIRLKHDLAWLEHRRWNAFTRVKGFRHSDNYGVYSACTGSYKNFPLKLHPCLVECDKLGIRTSLSAADIDNKTVFLSTEERELDFLDLLSLDLAEKNLNDYDFKIYDYPTFDF